MKRLLHALLFLLVLAALGWALWRGFTHRPSAEKEEAGAEETAPAGEHQEDEKPAAFTVALEKEKWEVLGLEIKPLAKAELRPQRQAFGRVLDPSPLIALDGDLASAEAALSASRAERERSQKLLAAGENTSRKAVETAEAQFRADEIKADALRRRALLEWGPAFAELAAAPRSALVEQLLHSQTALLRVDLLPGDAVPVQPKAARVLVLGREQQPLATEAIVPATDADPKTQAQGFILRIDRPPFPLRPGMALTAWLELPEEPRAGFGLPRSAVLRHDGRTWVYAAGEEDKFVRKPVALESPLPGEEGWFVATAGGLDPDDRIVVTGAQALLSEELKAQGGAEAD